MEMITKTDDIVSQPAEMVTQPAEMVIQLNSMFAFSPAPATLHPKEIINYIHPAPSGMCLRFGSL